MNLKLFSAPYCFIVFSPLVVLSHFSKSSFQRLAERESHSSLFFQRLIDVPIKSPPLVMIESKSLKSFVDHDGLIPSHSLLIRSWKLFSASTKVPLVSIPNPPAIFFFCASIIFCTPKIDPPQPIGRSGAVLAISSARPVTLVITSSIGPPQSVRESLINRRIKKSVSKSIKR